MCQAPIGKVVDAKGGEITVDYKGKRRKLRSRLLDVKKGDYVLFSLDIAIDKVDKEEAEMVLGNSE
jgi:hydrogenase maturation factor